MTTQQQATTTVTTAEDDGVRRAVAHLTTVLENLGPEHQALRTEEAKTSARERRGTVIRMGEGIVQAARAVALTVEALATVHGLLDLGVTWRFSKTADGGDYTPLPSLPDSTETLYQALTYLDEASVALGKAYTPTKKHPGLAVARCPEQMQVALTSLRAAMEAVCADVADAETTAEYAPALTFLDELKDRVCRPVPAFKHVVVSTELLRDLVAAGTGRVERDVAMWLMLQAGQQRHRSTDKIAAQLGYEQSQVDEALEKLQKAGVLREDGTVHGVHCGTASA
ncbi:hypothetical protein ACPCTN_31750 [Streptomyces cinereoruber]|uniref:hypothetical protein n=1 Tax=Streptomyces cinereoruber TaxID=67260 RepID=UPI003C2F363B